GRLINELGQRYLDSLAAQRRAGEVRDFGCGTGVLLKDMAEMGASVTGVDNSQAMIHAAQIHLSDPRVALEWIPNDSGEGAYESRVYDIVVCISVLEFVEELETVLSRLCSRVAPGGVLIVSVPNRDSWLRKIEKCAYRHPGMVRRFSRLSYLAQPECYLSIQTHQLTLQQLAQMVGREAMR